MSKLIYLNDDVDSTIERILSDEELGSCGLGVRKVLRALKSFQGDEIATSVFLKKYALRDENNIIIEYTLDEAKERWAKAIAAAEICFDTHFKDEMAYQYFRDLYEYFLPAGRQMYALGNPYVANATLSNCYVVTLEDDSIEGIFDAAKKIAKTYSYGGGVGLCVGKLRPRGARVSNSAKHSTGAVSFMELYSMTTGLIGQSGRRGALLLSIPVDHPDIEEFIEIKHNNTDKVKYANISIKITDEFMKAVIEDKDFELSYETSHEAFKKTIRAKDLWNKIIIAAHNSAEPGILFFDTAKRMSPSDTYPGMEIQTTNPCGEIWLEKGSACCLGSLLLHRFVENPYTEKASFNYDLLKKMVRRGVRHLDNVVELNIPRHALKEQREAATNGRRIGLGVTGLADMLVSLNIKYDSDEAIECVNSVMSAKMEAEYFASADLAKERGSFKLFDKNKHFTRGFCELLPENIKKYCMVQGLRNVTISTVAPSGSVSIIAQCSSGIEPIYALSYRRFVEMGQNRKEFKICHQGVTRWLETLEDDVNPDLNNLPTHWVVAHNINHSFRIKMQTIIQSKTDSSISSTINLPADVSPSVVGQIYIDAWQEGLKGITVYREGSREGVLLTEDFAKHAGTPDVDSIIKCVRAEGGDKFYIMISYKNRDIKNPYQVFVLNYKRIENDAFVRISNALIKMLTTQKVSERRIQKYVDRSQNSLAKFTRFLSLSMKTGNLDKAVEILEEHAFAGSLAARLHDILSNSLEMRKALCKKCNGSNVRMEEGCVRCLDCNWSGCN